MFNFCLIATIRQKLDIVVHFQTVITHKHKYKTNFAYFVLNRLCSEIKFEGIYTLGAFRNKDFRLPFASSCQTILSIFYYK